MNSNDFIEEFKCALSNKPHYVIKPVFLQCKHLACKKCIDNDANQKQIKCLICNTITDHNSELNQTSAESTIKNNIDKLFTSVESLFEKSLINFKGKYY